MSALKVLYIPGFESLLAVRLLQIAGCGGLHALKKHVSSGVLRIFRAACLQNETAPKSFNFKTKNGPKNDPKLPRKFLSLVLLCRISHWHYSKIFQREFPHKIKFFFTTRICRHGHAKNFLNKKYCKLFRTENTVKSWIWGVLCIENTSKPRI